MSPVMSSPLPDMQKRCVKPHSEVGGGAQAAGGSLYQLAVFSTVSKEYDPCKVITGAASKGGTHTVKEELILSTWHMGNSVSVCGGEQQAFFTCPCDCFSLNYPHFFK